MAALSPASFPTSNQNPEEAYEMTRIKIAPTARESGVTRRRNGRYRRHRNQAHQEIQQKDPYGQPPACREIRNRVKTFRNGTNYGSDSDDAQRQEPIRRNKYAAYEKRQEMRRSEQKP